VLCKNGETEDISRRFNPCDFLDKRERLGIIQDSSPEYGDGQIISNSFDRTGENTSGTASQSGEAADGKILERLEFIENAYLGYVQSHQQRLEERLVDSKEQEVIFKEAIQALKQEIHNLASGLEK
jgi:hypothetical protein